MTSALLGRDLPPRPDPGPVDGSTLTLRQWREQKQVAILMTGWRATLYTGGRLSPADMAVTGPCEDDVRAWRERAQQAGTGWGAGSDGQVPILSLAWALDDLFGRFPILSLDAAMAWALSTVGRRGSITETADSWFQPLGLIGLEHGWLFDAAGMSPGEVRSLPRDEVLAHLADHRPLRVMAALRGVPVPTRPPQVRQDYLADDRFGWARGVALLP